MGYESQVELVYQDQRADAKSIMHMMMLAAVEGAEVTIEATGPDAQQVVEALAALVESDFDNDPPTKQDGPSPDGAVRQQA